MAYAEVDSTAPRERALVVTTAWLEKGRISAIPGAHYDARGSVGAEQQWRLPLSWASCIILRGVFGKDLEVGPVLTAWARHTGWFVNRALELRELTTDESDPLGDLPDGLYPFQRVGAMWLVIAGSGALLADDMGSGKTIQALAAISYLANDRPSQVLPALIVCPNSIKHHWAERVPTWCPKATPYVVEGSAAQRRKVLKAAREDPSAIVIINVEAARLFSRLAPFGSIALKRCRECDPRTGDETLSTARCETHRKELNGFGFRLVILDEAHAVKDTTSKQTRAMWAIMHDPSVRRRWALTGTPMARHPGDLWPVMHAIAPLDFPNKSKWMDRYALMGPNPFGGMDIIGLRLETRDELFRYLDPRMRRMLKSVILPQLPPKVYEIRHVTMTPNQRRFYNDLAERLHAVNEDGDLFIVANRLVATTRLTQLASSSLDIVKPDEDDISTWEVTLREPSPKIDELEAVLYELGDRPCVVAAEHKQLINLANERLTSHGIRTGLITGDQSTEQRQQALDDLANKRIRVLLFTMKAGGQGLDMSAVDTLIFLQRPWSMVENVQTEDRVHRIGSERHEAITVIDIVTKDTIEERQVSRLYERTQMLEEINRDRAALIAAGLDASELDRRTTHLLHSFLDSPLEMP